MNKNKKENNKKVYKITTFLLCVSFIIFLLRPAFHWFFMPFYRTPSIIEAFILAILIIYGFYRENLKKSKNDKIELVKLRVNSISLFIFVFFTFVMIFSILQHFYMNIYLSHHLKCEKIKDLPNVDPAVVRIVPKVVSKKYAEDALQFSRYRLGQGSIVFMNKTPYWSYGLIPDGLINTFVLKDKGAIYVDMSIFGKRTKIVEKSMRIGEGMLLTDSYLWQIYERDYWIDKENPYFVPYNDHLYLIVPVVGYKFHFKFPIIFTTPFWKGIYLISDNGSIIFLTPKQAEDIEILKGQKLFPAKLTKIYINSFNYVHGILNVLLYHKDQFKIADVPGQSNEQPFLVVTKKGLKWIVACEPYGQSYGIYRIYVVNARNGEINVYQPKKTQALIGPVRSVDYVKQAIPRVDWQTMRAVEPIPVIVNKTLYWQVRIIPSDASGIAYVAMVNSENPNDVIILRTTNEVKAFLENGESMVKNTTNENRNTSKIIYYIVIEKNGKILKKLPVYYGETVEIRNQ